MYIRIIFLERTYYKFREKMWKFPVLQTFVGIGWNRGVSIPSNADWFALPSLFYTGLVAYTSSSILIIATRWQTQTFYQNFRSINLFDHFSKNLRYFLITTLVPLYYKYRIKYLNYLYNVFLIKSYICISVMMSNKTKFLYKFQKYYNTLSLSNKIYKIKKRIKKTHFIFLNKKLLLIWT